MTSDLFILFIKVHYILDSLYWVHTMAFICDISFSKKLFLEKKKKPVNKIETCRLDFLPVPSVRSVPSKLLSIYTKWKLDTRIFIQIVT